MRKIINIIPVLMVGLVLSLSCNSPYNTDKKTTQHIPPWDTGQNADAVFGQVDLTAYASPSASQFQITGPFGLAISSSGTLFVVDQNNNRVLRFDGSLTKVNGANADSLTGQPDYTTAIWNYGFGGSTPSAQGFETPWGAAIDSSGNIYVADRGNNRVLRFSSTTIGSSAVNVLGQLSFTAKAPGTTISTMQSPTGVAVDSFGNLYVADTENNRVLRFNLAASKSNGADADAVFGQPDFTTFTFGTSSLKMFTPSGLVIDNAGNLYVADRNNSRVLIFLNAASRSNGASADIVLGKATFTDTSTPVTANQSNIYLPYSVAIDASGTLYIADGGFNRVLVYYNASLKSNGAVADAVLGKTSFTNGTSTGVGVNNIGQPYGVAVHSQSGALFISDYANSRVLRFQAKSSLMP
jgi:sugar lactone lactonase YvrE